MIFPDFRISELQQDMERKRQKLNISTESFLAESRSILQPVSLLKNNKKLIMAGIVGLVAAGKIFGKVSKVVAPQMKGGMIFSMFKAAWFWKLLNFSYDLYKLTYGKSKRSRA